MSPSPMTNDPARLRLSGMFIDAAAAAEQRDEIAPFNWSSSIRSPAGQGRIEDIQLARDQSARTNPSLFTTRCSLTDAQSPFGVNRYRSLAVEPDAKSAVARKLT
jgi:hypothetical protein